VHLEFGDLDFENDQGAEVLILGGDICVTADVDVYDPRTREHGFSRAR